MHANQLASFYEALVIHVFKLLGSQVPEYSSTKVLEYLRCAQVQCMWWHLVCPTLTTWQPHHATQLEPPPPLSPYHFPLRLRLQFMCILKLLTD